MQVRPNGNRLLCETLAANSTKTSPNPVITHEQLKPSTVISIEIALQLSYLSYRNSTLNHRL